MGQNGRSIVLVFAFVVVLALVTDVLASPGTNPPETDKSTLYVVHWTHSPENCPGRSEDGAKMLKSFWEGRKKAEEKGVKILGAYVAVPGHEYYIIVEASDYSAVVEFFLPLIPTQTGKFTPVLTMDEWLKIMPK